jgi:hypothetical protein
MLNARGALYILLVVLAILILVILIHDHIIVH